jgi:hypothetical protein
VHVEGAVGESARAIARSSVATDDVVGPRRDFADAYRGDVDNRRVFFISIRGTRIA